MKKILLSLSLLLTAGAASAQVDTLSEFFTGSLAVYQVDVAAPVDSGYISGTNVYGDLAKLQRFDPSHGVTATGDITSILLALPIKVDAGGSFQVGIFPDNAGEPNMLAPLGAVSIDLADVDTAVASFNLIGDGTNPTFYNVAATFATPVAIPSSGVFWVGVVLPTGANELAMFTNQSGDFPDASTNSGEVWSDGTFSTYPNAWGAAATFANAIFPVVNFTGGPVGGLKENAIEAVAYPNPASDVLNIKMGENVEAVSIISMDGKVVSTQVVNGTTVSVPVADLNAGVYFYEVQTANGTVRHTFVKK